WRRLPRLDGRFLDGRRLRIERQPRNAGGADAGEIALECGAKALQSERLHQELHAVALLVLVVAEAMEHAHDRFGNREHLTRRDELEQQLAGSAQPRASPSHAEDET